MSGLKPFIAKIATRQPLTRQEASDAFEILMSGEASMAQVGGFLMALRVRGETVDEIAGISAGGMPDRVKCLHALIGHALAAGPGVNPIGDIALELCSWSPSRCVCESF